MELGEKIRQARQEKGLSQRQLCGDRLTRNMLSLIENGSARPSMDTLQYFARRLEKPVSWFLEEPFTLSPDDTVMQAARSQFAAGEYRQVTRTLEDYRGAEGQTHGEKFLLEALSLMEQARGAIREDKLIYARSLLEKAAPAGEQTPYFTPACHREWVLLMAQAAPEEADRWEKELPEDSRELMLRAKAALDRGEYGRSACLLDALDSRDAQWYCMRGRVAMAQKEYEVARTYFQKAEEAFPQLCAQALETCCRELEDYKMAYYYACKLRQME